MIILSVLDGKKSTEGGRVIFFNWINFWKSFISEMGNYPIGLNSNPPLGNPGNVPVLQQ